MDGPALKATLKRLGLRQCELAKLLNMTPRAINLYAKNKRSIHPAIVVYLNLMRKYKTVHNAEMLRLTQMKIADEFSKS